MNYCRRISFFFLLFFAKENPFEQIKIPSKSFSQYSFTCLKYRFVREYFFFFFFLQRWIKIWTLYTRKIFLYSRGIKKIIFLRILQYIEHRYSIKKRIRNFNIPVLYWLLTVLLQVNVYISFISCMYSQSQNFS